LINLLLASSNSHKVEEFSELFNKEVVAVELPSEKLEVEETGKSFHQNALLKAEAYYKRYKQPVISDDSGLCVEALPNELGIYSARFGEKDFNDKDRALHLLDKLKELPKDKKTAYFCCILCCYISPDEIFYFEGRIEGSIGEEYRGEHGFGYDPIFIPAMNSEHTMAEIPEWKQKNSHRALACQFAERFFQERNCQNL
jgi:XTP/dITP diphosphohydrolase